MKASHLVLCLVLLAIIGGGAYYLVNESSEPTANPSPTPSIEATGTVTPSPAATPLSATDITVTTPLSGSTVTNPLKVTGTAVGGWYSEAQFSITLVDSSGNELASGTAQAQGDWMTTDFVPYEATLQFSAPSVAGGTLILHKANPSGLPTSDKTIEVPVLFTK